MDLEQPTIESNVAAAGGSLPANAAEIERLDAEAFADASLKTPAFVYHAPLIEHNARLLAGIGHRTGIRFTYSMKACAVEAVLRMINPYVTGFSVSSVFEASLCKEVLGDHFRDRTIHATNPCFTHTDFDQLVEICDYISLNSLSQLRALANQPGKSASFGLRVNPGISYVADERYDPCRPHSKLGVPLGDVQRVWRSEQNALASVSGLHFHTNCSSNDFEPLVRTVEAVANAAPEFLHNASWLNAGGGYLFDQSETTLGWLDRMCGYLREFEPLTLFMEPGEHLVGEAGYLVSTVIDMFDRENRRIVVLDTSINHIPECFEYQFEPDVLATTDDGYEYLLAGCSCLAGDIFGDYCFADPLAVGDRIVFSNVGAYGQAKANFFTGIPFPATYVCDKAGLFHLENEAGFDAYRRLWRSSATI